MIIHHIHDDTNTNVIGLLKIAFSSTNDQNIIKNYHPDFSEEPGNFFYILKSGRYRQGKGKYFVIEEDNKYISSAGWNEYDFDPSLALALTRMFVDKKYRTKFTIGNYILPGIINETSSYERVWMTTNQYNYPLYQWFERAEKGKTPSLGKWPDIYRNFYPIGKKEIYNTIQDIVELKR